MENAVSVSYYLIKKTKEKKQSGSTGEEIKLTPLKLQKLLYFAQGIYLKNNEEPLFDDPIQAMDYGPVILSVYRYFKAKGYTNENLAEVIPDDNELNKKIGEIGDDYKKFLDAFFDVFSKYSSVQLVNASHNHTIWQQAHRSYDNRMPVEKIKSFFREI